MSLGSVLVGACVGGLGASAAAGEHIHLFVFAGQSNMVGGNPVNAQHAGVLGLPFEQSLEGINPDWYEPEPDVRYTHRLSTINDGGWHELVHHRWNPSGTSWGPDLPFGHLIHEAWPEANIAVIKTAFGGTALNSSWLARVGDPDPRFPYETLYEDSMEFIYMRVQELLLEGHTVEVEGFFWVQGYGDLGRNSFTNEYQEGLTELSALVREDLDVPDLPFFFTRQHINTDETRAFRLPRFRCEQEQFADSDPNAYLIDIDDVGFRDNGIHYDGQAAAVMGERFFQKFIEHEAGTATSDHDSAETPDPCPEIPEV
ncbi:MAG: sialate O-acetylesterase [Planctomycetota bacterium]